MMKCVSTARLSELLAIKASGCAPCRAIDLLYRQLVRLDPKWGKATHHSIRPEHQPWVAQADIDAGHPAGANGGLTVTDGTASGEGAPGNGSCNSGAVASPTAAPGEPAAKVAADSSDVAAAVQDLGAAPSAGAANAAEGPVSKQSDGDGPGQPQQQGHDAAVNAGTAKAVPTRQRQSGYHLADAGALRGVLAGGGFTSCILAAPQLEAVSLLQQVMPLLAPSAPFVMYSAWMQPLAECAAYLRVSAGRGGE
jgi:hypothetical protein